MKHRPIAGILTNKDRRLLGDVFDIAQYVLGRRVDRGARNSPPKRFRKSPRACRRRGAVARLVGIEGGVVSGVINLESSGVEASDWRPRHDEPYHEV